MGLEPPRIYLDSCLVIYLVEEREDFAAITEAELSGNPDLKIFVSDLTILECMVLPFRQQKTLLINKFDSWFSNTTVLRLPKKVFKDAARLRADHPPLKTPDALHLATAIHHDCGEFWTNDDRLQMTAPDLVRNIITPTKTS